MPLANLYRQAQAPLEVFCQHGRRWNARDPQLPSNCSPARPSRPTWPRPTRCPHSHPMPSTSSPTPIPCSRCARAARAATGRT